MKYTFECKACHKIALCDSKAELQAMKDKHWMYNKQGLKMHKPILDAMSIETRTSKNSHRPYVVLVAD